MRNKHIRTCTTLSPSLPPLPPSPPPPKKSLKILSHWTSAPASECMCCGEFSALWVSSINASEVEIRKDFNLFVYPPTSLLFPPPIPRKSARSKSPPSWKKQIKARHKNHTALRQHINYSEYYFLSLLTFHLHLTSPLLPQILKQHCTRCAGGNRHAADDGNAHQPLLGHLVIDQPP